MAQPHIQLAAAPVSWGVTEVAEGVARLPWGQVMDEIARAGYAATELGPYGYYPTGATELRAALDARGLALTSAYVPLPLHDSAAFAQAQDEALSIGRLLAELGAEYIVLASSGDERRAALAGRVPADGSAGLDDAQWHAAADGLQSLARRCRELGLLAVFHHHAGTHVETPDELATLCRLTDPDLIAICLDTGHYVYGGGNPREALATYGERVRYVHLKDIDAARLAQARAQGWSFVEGVERGVFTALGRGAAEIAGCIDDLRSRGYRGWAVVEQDIIGERDADGRTPLEGMTAAREYLRTVLEKKAS
jgi:inosose dehydratase